MFTIFSIEIVDIFTEQWLHWESLSLLFFQKCFVFFSWTISTCSIIADKVKVLSWVHFSLISFNFFLFFTLIWLSFVCSQTHKHWVISIMNFELRKLFVSWLSFNFVSFNRSKVFHVDFKTCFKSFARFLFLIWKKTHKSHVHTHEFCILKLFYSKMLIIQLSLIAVSVSDRPFLYSFFNSLFCTFQNWFSIRWKEIVSFLLFGLRWALETLLCHCLCCYSLKRQTVRHYWNAITLVCWCVCSSMKPYFTWVFHANKFSWSDNRLGYCCCCHFQSIFMSYSHALNLFHMIFSRFSSWTLHTINWISFINNWPNKSKVDGVFSVVETTKVQICRSLSVCVSLSVCWFQ